ncbi:MAG: hypothetical protein J3Q66DRAFT_396497 [Benniella sp.]|nr:MAG: hypothetical protein J3Q66DRAFT_396497 [Benniella sp.]
MKFSRLHAWLCKGLSHVRVFGSRHAVEIQRPDFLRKTKHSKENHEDSKYTYVVLRKEPRPLFNSPTSPPTNIDLNGNFYINTTRALFAKRTKYKKPPPPPPVTYDNPEDMFAASHSWSRIVVPPLKKDGYLERIIIPRNKPVRRELVESGDSETSVEENPHELQMDAKRRPSVSPQKLLKQAKQNVKKQSRRKFSLENLDTSKKGRNGKNDDSEAMVFFGGQRLPRSL